jgi:hypothetical protein
MDDTAIMTEFKNLKHRVVAVEQILPTLVTKGDLLVTKNELRAEIAATKDELRAEIVESRRYTEERTHRLEVLIESVRDDVRLVAEAQAASVERQDRMWNDVRRMFVGMDRRVTRLEARMPPDAAV